MEYLNLVGLILNLTGTIFVAFSFGKNPDDAYQEVNNKKIYLASFLVNSHAVIPKFFGEPAVSSGKKYLESN